MNEEINEQDCFPLRVVRVRSNGKHDYDPVAKRRLIELCRRPGVSIAGTALRAQVNANQLRKWVRAARQSEALVPCLVAPQVSAFVPVRAAVPTTLAPAIPPAKLVATVHVRLPNGIQLDIEKSDLAELTAVIEMLGRLPCSGLTKA